jgi:hypothetical protein
MTTIRTDFQRWLDGETCIYGRLTPPPGCYLLSKVMYSTQLKARVLQPSPSACTHGRVLKVARRHEFSDGVSIKT